MEKNGIMSEEDIKNHEKNVTDGNNNNREHPPKRESSRKSEELQKKPK